jgi:predicted ATPase/signal transduction histidine kinase
MIKNLKKRIQEGEYSIILKSKYSKLFRVKNSEDNAIYLVKELNEHNLSSSFYQTLFNNYKLLEDNQSDKLIKIIDNIVQHNYLAFVFKDNRGLLLSDNSVISKLTLIELLNLFVKMAQAVDDLHNSRLILRIITPNSFLFNSEDSDLILFDIDNAIDNNKESVSILQELSISNMQYASPEATGRLNSNIDTRADIYSLGITFYELLSGVLPYEFSSPLQMLHDHLVKDPIDLKKVKKGIPGVISSIVMKMIRKSPENRYQSIQSVIHDFKQFIDKTDHFNLNNQVVSVSYDSKAIFKIPDKLYGMSEKISDIQNIINDDDINKRIIFISGLPGSGKTSLINRIIRESLDDNIQMFYGKFEENSTKNIYGGIISACRSIVEYIMQKSEDEIILWKERVTSALEHNGQILIDIIPELEKLIGKQPEPITLPANEAKFRLSHLFQEFIKVIANSSKRFVLIVDDLQWASQASLDLLKDILIDNKNGRIVLIGIYRDDEVDGKHILSKTITEIEELRINISKINTEELKIGSIKELISDTLLQDDSHTSELADICYSKTNGNPLFIRQLLSSLNDQEYIHFDSNINKWTFDINDIKSISLSDNVVEFIENKISELDEETVGILKTASLLGNNFLINDLAIITGKKQERISMLLQKAVNKDYIIQIDEKNKSAAQGYLGKYKFSHDKILQAINNLFSSDEAEKEYLRIARLLYQNKKESSKFDHSNILNYYNYGSSYIDAAEEKEMLARLNLSEAKRSMASGALKQAYYYAQSGINVLNDNDWKMYDLSFDLHLIAAEASYSEIGYEKSIEIIESSYKKCKSNVDKAEFLYIRCIVSYYKFKSQDGFETGIKALKLIGIEFPDDPATNDIMIQYNKMNELLKQTNLEEYLNSVFIVDRELLLKHKLLTIMTLLSFIYQTYHSPLIIMKHLETSLNFGLTSYSSVGFITYALILSNMFGNVEEGYKYGKFSLDLLSKHEETEKKARIKLGYNFFVRHRKEHIRETLPSLYSGYKDGIIAGEIDAGIENYIGYWTHLMLLGEKASKQKEVLDNCNNLAKRHSQDRYIRSSIIHEEILDTLIEPRRNDLSETLNYMGDRILEFENNKDFNAICIFKSQSGVISYLFGDSEKAVDFFKDAAVHIHLIVGLAYNSWFRMFYSLSLIDLMRKNRKINEEYIKLIQENQQILKDWADHAPMNYLSKYLLVQAEYEALNKNPFVAMELYDQSIVSSRENGFRLDEALANELSGEFYLSISREKAAIPYLFDSIKCYYEMEAFGKVHHIKNKYQNLLYSSYLVNAYKKEMLDYESNQKAIESMLLDKFDLISIIDASQTISGEMNIDLLLEKMMTIVMQSGGASKGSLILLSDSRLYVEALSDVDNNISETLIHVNLEDCDYLPKNVINYVTMMKEGVNLGNATNSREFMYDTYLRRFSRLSLICLPLIVQTKLIGILYLENNKLYDAFHPSREELLIMLASQMAVSIENSMIYMDLDKMVKERTAVIVKQKMVLQMLNASKDKFFSILAHDLKNPFIEFHELTKYLNTNFEDLPSEEISSFLQKLYKSSDYLYHLLLNLLEWSKTQTGRIVFNPVFLNLNQIISEAMQVYLTSAEKKGIRLINRIDESKILYCDFNMLNSIIRNLLSNAIKFSNEGGVVEIILKEEKENILLIIEDNGIGIDKDKINNLFKLNQKVSSNGTNGEKGSGLGLLLCKEFMILHEGNIKVESEINVGTRFICSFPKISEQEIEE